MSRRRTGLGRKEPGAYGAGPGPWAYPAGPFTSVTVPGQGGVEISMRK